jgi:hypothetical protein
VACRTIDGEDVVIYTREGRYSTPSPILEQLPDGRLFTANYFTGADRITHLAGTRWSL